MRIMLSFQSAREILSTMILFIWSVVMGIPASAASFTISDTNPHDPAGFPFFISLTVWPFNDQCTHYIETSQLICFANKLTGFYMMGTLVVKRISMSFSIKRCKPLILFTTEKTYLQELFIAFPSYFLILITICQHILIIPHGLFLSLSLYANTSWSFLMDCSLIIS